MRFAGFIITYNRPEVLMNTILKVFDQTFPPVKLWIVDNSEEKITEELIQSFSDPRLCYIGIGYNSGPAHAINVGLELVASGGYEWCYWGDDDDPPPSNETFEKLFESLQTLPQKEQIGQMGIVGHRLNFKTGIIDQIKNKELEGDGIVYVDNIAGGQSKIVRADLWDQGVRISPDLFYGFEELDFDIQVKKLGFKSFVPKELYRRQRYHPQREAIMQERLLGENTLWRQYYSTRNLCGIYQKHQMYFAIFYLFLRKSFKLVWDFRKGLSYGVTSAKYNLLGIWHWMIGRYGKTI